MIRLVVAALLAAGCSGAPPLTAPASTGPAPTTPPSASPGRTSQLGKSAQAAPTSGCATAHPLKPGRHRLRFGGLDRLFLLSVPDGPGPHPILLDLHGLGSSAAQQSAYSRLAEVGSRRGYVVATPQAAQGRTGWTLPHTAGPDDTGFLAALLDHLERGLCVDAHREFAAGMSYGAGMAAALVCALQGRLAGVAPVAGVNIVRPCERPTPTTIVVFHGTADRIVPYRGGHPFRDATGSLRTLADLVVLPPVERTVEEWAHSLGCTSPTSGPAAGRFGTQVRVRSWKSCPGRAMLRLYTVDGGGHTWPGPIEVSRLGKTARDLDATALILNAFDHTPSR
ncbi:PHB depolymerase family esterase [Nonomuraea sp. NPDC049784]|uniref:alpha/beta hydrolase family esterase n=1 Tax=Nonomuraea sp. NPDC049784 TaxID=3154361 RepID=UPI0033EB4B39